MARPDVTYNLIQKIQFPKNPSPAPILLVHHP